MRYQYYCVAVATILLSSISQTPNGVTALGVPEFAVEERAVADIAPRNDAEDVAERLNFASLEKRKGGGGGGGRSGGGSSSGGSSSGGSSSGGSSSGGGRSGGSSSGGSTAGAGSRTVGYSSGYRTYGGRYSGGAVSPYRSGGRSPLGLAPFILPLAALSIFPGIWLYSVYAYNYHTPYNYYNQSTNQNQSVPVECLCQQYSDCGCDDDGDNSYLDDLIALNQSNTTTFSQVNGTTTLLINGTLANGTGAAAGTSMNVSSKMEALGYLWMVAVVAYMVSAV